MIRLAVILVCLAATLYAAEGKPLLHPLFSDHAVLQRDKPLPIWGWAAPGAVVNVSLAGQQAQATTEADGRWMTKLTSLTVGGPLEMTVTTGTTTVTVHDLLVGDVWLCSGQSNMQMGIGGVTNAAAEIAAANIPTLRLCWVRPRIALSPADTAELDWQVCTPVSVAAHGNWGGFSAAAFFFGRQLVADLNIPIGLIHSSWGGTPAQSWISAEALDPLDDFDAPLAELAGYRLNTNRASLAERMNTWWAANDPGSAAAWQKSTTDDAAWANMELPQHWETGGLPNFDGVVWFRRTFEIPADMAGHDLTVSLGPIDDRDTTFCDGVEIGALNEWNKNRIYTLPAAQATAGSHSIAVRVLDTGAPGGFHGKAEQMFVARADNDAQRLSLAGGWRYKDSKALKDMQPAPTSIEDNSHTPSVLFNGMINPLLPYALTGFTWYQGETNAWNAPQYRRLLPALISDWRTRFATPDGAFLIVQLASFMKRAETPIEEGWASLREAQSLTAGKVSKCGLAVAIDIGDGADIHPKNKQDVGKRLALAAEQIQYGKPVEGSGPQFVSFAIEAKAIRITMSHAAGLATVDNAAPLAFAIAGVDGRWVAADALIDGETLIVSSATVAEPTAVRYAWANNPAVNLINGAKLPAVPFQTNPPE